MNLYYEESGVAIFHGDALETLREMDDESADCCVTSPPYWGLRDYGVDGQLGLERTPEEYVARLVEVFREVRRVLRDDGTLWLNLGDSYASGKGTCYNPGGGESSLGKERKAEGVHPLDRGNKSTLAVSGLKPKDLVGIPWRVAFALQADGWYLRSDIIWAKPNPMPESVTDRPTKSHEYLFLLARSERYYYDAKAVAEPAVSSRGDEMRNRRSVWTIPTRPFSGAHFAVFPEALAEVCILAGTPAGGVVLDPFGGAGTVGVVAGRLGRRAMLVELKEEYCELAAGRLARSMDMNGNERMKG
jgi:site-specific DNA-methyltransferase (adenine-specific)